MFHRATVIAASSFLALSLLTVSARQSQPPQPAAGQAQPTFRTGVNLVELPVRITDRQSNFVRDLKQSDFEVYEDGVRQEIASFRLVDLPLPDPRKPFVEPRPGAAPATPLVLHEGDTIDGRIYLFVLDDYHLLPQYSYRVKVIVESFVRQRMGPQDIAAITYTSQTPGQDFTRDRRALVSSLGRFMGSLDALEPGGTQFVKSIAVLDKIRSMAEVLGHIRGRHKALVFITPTLGCVTQEQAMPPVSAPTSPTGLVSGNGRVVNTPTPNTTPSRCFNTLWDSVSAATQANVSIYSFDPTVTENPGWASPSIDGRGGPDAAVQLQQASDGNPTSVFDGARVLASETGGFSVFNVNNFSKALDRIVREHSLYYLIGYYPSNDKADGKVRKNAVALSRNDVQASYRPAYTAPKN